MTSIGFLKKIDKAGRIVIPKELRNFFKIDKETKMEIIGTDKGILIRILEYEVKKAKKANPTIKEDIAEKEKLLKEPIIGDVLCAVSSEIGVTPEEYIDRFIEVFLREPESIMNILNKKCKLEI